MSKKKLVVTQAYAKMILAFRRSAYIAPMRTLLAVELEKARQEYEATFGASEAKAYIDALKRLDAVFFSAEVVL